MRPLLLAAALCAAASSAGCVGLSRSSAIKPIDAAVAAGSRVAEIRLTVEDEVTTRPEFQGIFRERVQAKLNECATGARPLRLEAEITRLDRANPVQVAIIGGANVLRGGARLVDPATGQTVGEYQIGHTVMGGRVGVFQMAESEEQLSDAFGQELCEQAFAGEE